MKRIAASQTLFITVLVSATGWLATAQQPTIKRVPIQPTTAMDGAALFLKYCAVCHGKGGKGNGPAAEALKKRPADLTQITRRNSGKFPEVAVMRVINGDDVVAAHGLRDMPTWGELFTQGNNPDMGQGRVYSLMKYIEQIQAK